MKQDIKALQGKIAKLDAYIKQQTAERDAIANVMEKLRPYMEPNPEMTVEEAMKLYALDNP